MLEEGNTWCFISAVTCAAKAAAPAHWCVPIGYPANRLERSPLRSWCQTTLPSTQSGRVSMLMFYAHSTSAVKSGRYKMEEEEEEEEETKK